MTKFKRFAAIGLAAVMSIAAFAGCGTSSSSSSGSGDSTKADTPTNNGGEDGTKAPDASGRDYSDVGEGEGKVLNIYVWNEEFKQRLEEFYPGYEKVDGTTGKIGDVTVKFTINENTGSNYQDKLDMQLDNEDKGGVADDEKIDIFLVEADYALKYVDDPATLDITELGITKDDLANQYTYTQDVMTSGDGKLKGLTWQACPGVMIYNKEIAKDVLGSDDADTVQAAVKDWATFEATAKTMSDKGYKMLSSFEDSYRVFSNNVSSKWVDEDGKKIVVDDRIMEWVKQTKNFADNGYNESSKLWDDTWTASQEAGQKVFAYFGPAWFVDFTLAHEIKDKDGNGTGEYTNQGAWSICEGPENYFWGGTWICASAGTDNKTLVKNIMLALTADTEIMTEICKQKSDFVNDKPAMDVMADDTEYKSPFLLINPIPYYKAGVANIDLKYLGEYDQGCNEEFQDAMRNYFLGAATLEEAMDAFKTAIGEKYPKLADYELVYTAE